MVHKDEKNHDKMGINEICATHCTCPRPCDIGTWSSGGEKRAGVGRSGSQLVQAQSAAAWLAVAGEAGAGGW